MQTQKTLWNESSERAVLTRLGKKYTEIVFEANSDVPLTDGIAKSFGTEDEAKRHFDMRVQAFGNAGYREF